MYQDIEYNGICGSALKIFARERPSIPAARKRRTEIVIPGRDGSLYTTENEYEPTEIRIRFNYIGEEKRWAGRWRAAKKWLSAENSTLRFSDDAGYFYRVAYVELGEAERTTARIGNFEAVFVTRDGLQYPDEGTWEYEKEKVKWNPYELSHPIYKITGEGTCTLEVNGNQMKANVGQNLIIDTDRMISFREDGTLQNTRVSGKYEDLYLNPGENSFQISDGFELKIIPNWRCR